MKTNDFEDFENSMKLIQEYSSDQFNRNKKEDVLEVKRLSNIRRKSIQSKKLENSYTNKSVYNFCTNDIMQKKGVVSYSQLANDLNIQEKRRRSTINENVFSLLNQNKLPKNKISNQNPTINELDEEDTENRERKKETSPLGLNSQRNNLKIYNYLKKERKSSNSELEYINEKNIFNQINDSNLNLISNYNNSQINKTNDFNACKLTDNDRKNSLKKNFFINKRGSFIKIFSPSQVLINNFSASATNKESFSDDDIYLNENYGDKSPSTSLFKFGSMKKKNILVSIPVDNNRSCISDYEKSISKYSNSEDEIKEDNNQNNIRKMDSNKSVKFQRFSFSRLSIIDPRKSIMSIANNDVSNIQNINLDNQINSIQISMEKYSKKFEEIDFNIFQYIEVCGRDNVLINISDYLFEKHSLYCFIDKKMFETFIDKIRLGYDNLLPYHNDLHAVDVLHTCSILMNYLHLINSIHLNFLDVSGFFIAAIIHDFKHPGLNNSYQINKKSKLANRYNDISVLENFHISAAFKIISKSNSNIFKDLHVEEYRVIRKRIVECVLATDMAKHTKALTSLRIKIESLKKKENNNDNNVIESNNEEEDITVLERLVNNLEIDNKFDRQQEILNFLIHSADISNASKPFNICRIWTNLVMEEFFIQGDLEKKKGLPVSFLCDRNTTNIPKSQIGFISNIVLPNFKILCMLDNKCNIFIDNLMNNIENWIKEDEKLQKTNLEKSASAININK